MHWLLGPHLEQRDHDSVGSFACSDELTHTCKYAQHDMTATVSMVGNRKHGSTETMPGH